MYEHNFGGRHLPKAFTYMPTTDFDVWTNILTFVECVIIFDKATVYFISLFLYCLYQHRINIIIMLIDADKTVNNY